MAKLFYRLKKFLPKILTLTQVTAVEKEKLKLDV